MQDKDKQITKIENLFDLDKSEAERIIAKTSGKSLFLPLMGMVSSLFEKYDLKVMKDEERKYEKIEVEKTLDKLLEAGLPEKKAEEIVSSYVGDFVYYRDYPHGLALLKDKIIIYKEKADFIPEVTKEEKKIWMTTDNLKKQFLSYFIEVEQRYHAYLFWQEKYGPATVQEFDWGTEQNNPHFSIFPLKPGIGPELNMGHGHNTSGLRCLGSGRLEDFIRLDQKSREEIGRLARKFEDQDLEVGYIACTFLYPEESKKATPEDYPLHMKSDIFYQLISQKENWPEEKTGEKAREKTFAWARQNPDQLISFRKEKLETAKNLMESFQSLVSDYLDLLKVF